MRLCAAVAFLIVVAPAGAQENLTVLPADDGAAPPRRLLRAYLLAEAQKHFDARRAAVAALATPDDLRQRQHELKARFREALGDFPEKTPLNSRVVGAERRDGYRVE